MRPLVETIREIKENQETLRTRPYGVIEVAGGKLVRIQLRPWPKLASRLEAHWRNVKPKRNQQNACRVFYNQPVGHRNFLALAYVESSMNTQLKTLFTAFDVLNQIAFIKRSDAILAEVTNHRITDRCLMKRGWERHLEHKRQRHWIRRFYGEYPKSAQLFTQSSATKVDQNVKAFS